MTETYQPIRELIDRARARWRLLRLFHAAVRGAAAATALLAVGLVAAQFADRSPFILIALMASSAMLVAGALVWGLAPLRHVPSDRRVARFIEERAPGLDDRLVTAVDFVESFASRPSSSLGGLMLADAAARARGVELDAVLPPPVLRRAGLQAAGATLALLVVAFFAAGPVRQSVDAASLLLFPSRVQRSVQPTDAVAVAHPPRVTRVDLEYTYPSSLGLKPRSEEDSGDIYAPSGTGVRVRVHMDRPAASGRLALTDGQAVPLSGTEPGVMSAALTIVADGSYRITLADGDGLSSEGDTEYFIRVLEDRPPDVHVTKPAGDRPVTRLEEVDIEASADDDYGVERLELVYAVRGGDEKAVALDFPRHATSVSARHTLFLEDLDVQPGDFVSYYVRARDLTRGRRSNEARSDIFFLDVKPYEQEFTLAQSQSMSGSGYSGALDELVGKQRQVVVATWKLNRRARNANRDIRSVAETESNLKRLVEQAASTFRESTMRDPRRRAPGAAASGPTRPEEDAMAAAGDAMGRAVTSLEALKTGDALPPEMEALNHLLKAQAEIKRRQVSTNQSAAGSSGSTNKNYDISTLFDRELQRQQRTNYETPQGARLPQDGTDALDNIKDLAKRQDELMRRQQELARAGLPAEERKRELEKLTREQSDLRQRAEDLEQQLSDSRSNESGQSPNSRNGTGTGTGAEQRQMREVSEQMRQAAGDLRRGSPEQAGASAGRAVDKLRDLERRMQSGRPDERRRAAWGRAIEQALGDMRLEASQLADGERQAATALGKLPPGDRGKEALRQLAGDQERLADRARRLHEDLKQQAATASRIGKGDQNQDAALRDATRAADGLANRMQRSAEDMRAPAPAPAPSSRAQAAAQQEIARQLDRLAERLGAAIGATDDDAGKLSEQLGRTEELRDKLDQIGRALENAGRESGRAGGPSRQKSAGESGRTGEGRQGGGGTDITRLREESLRQLQDAKELLEELRRQDPSFSKNGAGFTLEGQGMVMSAPGTEAFKQDFEKWSLLKRQVQAALEQAGSTLAKKVQAAVAKDRLAAGVEDTAPRDYQKQVDAYFKALADRKR